jgi:hypothetical protein
VEASGTSTPEQARQPGRGQIRRHYGGKLVTQNLCTVEHCGRPRPEYAFICASCAGQLRQDLGDIPALLDDLDITLSRQDVLLGKSPSRSSVVPMPFKPATSETRWVLVNTVTTWVRLLHEETAAKSALPTDVRGCARWLLGYVRSVAMHPDAGEAADEIRSAVSDAYRAIDYVVDSRAYLGYCGDVAGRRGCRGKVYARPSAAVGTCDTCSEEYDVRSRRALMLRAMSNQKITAADIATMLQGLGIEISVQEIQNVGRTGRIKAVSKDAHGKRSYLVGDVLRVFLGAESLSA